MALVSKPVKNKPIEDAKKINDFIDRGKSFTADKQQQISKVQLRMSYELLWQIDDHAGRSRPIVKRSYWINQAVYDKLSREGVNLTFSLPAPSYASGKKKKVDLRGREADQVHMHQQRLPTELLEAVDQHLAGKGIKRHPFLIEAIYERLEKI